MVDETSNPSAISEADLNAVSSVLQDLKAKARDAYQKNNPALLSIYTDLIKVVSPRVVRLHARVERETMAAMRKNHKAMKPKQAKHATS
jgi:hypothetical protein